MSGAGAISCGCCGPYYTLYDCCDPPDPPAHSYYVTEAEYLADSPCVGGVRFGLYDGKYYQFDVSSGPLEEKPDLPHFPGVVTCDVCRFPRAYSSCNGHYCETTIDNMDVYVPVEVQKASLTFTPPSSCSSSGLTSPCPGGIKYIKFAASDVGVLFTNQKTGDRCGSDLAWYRAASGYALGGYKCNGDEITSVNFRNGFGLIRTCAMNRDCPPDEFDLCDIDLDEFTFLWSVLVGTTECDLCGLS